MAKKTTVRSAEKGSYLIAATTLISTGVVLVEKNLVAGALLVILGASLFIIRELRK